MKTGTRVGGAVERWLEVRAERELPADAPLFCTLDGKKLDHRYVRSTLQRLAKGAGWTKRIHPHGLRHTYASKLVLNGVSPAIIQRMLGHTSLDTTSKYLEGISTDDVDEAMDRVRW